MSVLFAVNLLFLPIFSGLRLVPLAALNILVVWATFLCSIVAVCRHQR